MKQNILIGAMALTIVVLLVERISPAKAQSEFDMFITMTKIELMEENIQTLLSYSQTINSNVEMNGYDLDSLENKLEKRLGYIEQNQQILMLQTQNIETLVK